MHYSRVPPSRRRTVTFEKRSSPGSSAPSAPSAPAALRVALLGTGAAAHCAWAAVHDAGHAIVVVGGRDAADAAAFINAHGGRVAGSPSTTTATAAIIQTASTSTSTTTTTTTTTTGAVRACGYDEAVNTRDVDALHITLPLAEREQWVGKCIRMRKHIFLSSPAAPSVAALQRWMEAVTPLRLLLVDSAALAYSVRLTQLRACFGPETLVGPMRGIRLSCAAGAVENNNHSNNNNDNNSSEKREDVKEKESDVFGEMLWRSVAALLQVVGEKAPVALMARALRRSDKSNNNNNNNNNNAMREIAAEIIFREKQQANPSTVLSSDMTAALYVSRAGPAEQCLTAYGSGGSVTVHDALVPLQEAEGFLHIATEDKVQSPTHRGSSRCVRCEREEPVKETAEERSVGLPWRRFRAALVANPQAAGSLYASKFRGDTEEGLAAMRRMWETQFIVDGLMSAVKKTSEAES